jgi:3-deoxy-D-manno-octulosonate 8-phosphate phosphatase (KDO 8-P phosphatase)
MNWASIKLLLLDVDGVLTDGCLLSSTDGAWEKSFYVQDGCAVKMWIAAGGKVGIVTGRREDAVQRRAEELGIEIIHTGVACKAEALNAILLSMNMAPDEVAFVGDDLPDLAAMRSVGFPVAVANAHPAVKRSAAYVSRRHGGRGAVA